MMRCCRAVLAFLAPAIIATGLRVVFDVSHLGFVFRALITALAAVVLRRRRGGEPLRLVLPRKLRSARESVDSPAKLRAETPLAVGAAAVLSFPFIALAATQSFGANGVSLPPAADARAALWLIGIALAGAVVVLDCTLGLGTCMRALARDGFSSALLAVNVALAVLPALMIFWRVESRPAWLAVMAAQFVWMFAGFIVGGIVTGRRRTRLSPPPPPRSPDAWMAAYGIEANHDVVLVSPGVRKIPVIMEVRKLTGMGLKEAKDLIDTAPGLVMTRVTSERADRARTVLEGLGATITVTTASDGLLIV